MIVYRKLDVTPKSYQNEGERFRVRVDCGGKPVAGLEPDRVTEVKEKVEELDLADHVYQWFVRNVQDGKTDRYEERHIAKDVLSHLLEDCETVLNASHLVWAEPFQAGDYGMIRRRMESRREPTKVIKNVAVAHRLLPMKTGWNHPSIDVYGEEYLKGVKAARDWAERILMDLEKGTPGQLTYFIK